MRSRIRQLAALSVIALLGSLFAIPSTAQAQANLTVQVSNPIFLGANCNPETFEGCRSGESMRFLAPTLNVHKGDNLTFDFAGFHTASLLPVGQDWLAFRAANTGGVGRQYSQVIPDPDDSTAEGAPADKPAVKANPNVVNRHIGGTPAQCGDAANPCIYDGDKVVHSGLPFGPGAFVVRINANPGQGFWVMCFLHTHMVLRVNVVGNNETATTQAQIDSTKASMIAFDQEWAQSTDAQLLRAKASHVTASGERVYDVKTGVDSHWANINAFYPKKLSVPRGATVRYHFEQLIYEDHTATMPTGTDAAPGGFALFDEFFVPSCDPDGDGGVGPDTPANFDAQDPSQLCANPTQLEFDVSSRGTWGFGDGIFTGRSDLEHSGFRGPQGTTQNFYDVTFQARSTKAGWGVFCLVHGPSMLNKVLVKPLR
ncbi:MAG: hypothetical protein ABR505_10555 [Actinomycetota bacterium]